MIAHFIGIGGIGMSALARYFSSRGVTVTGSDMGSSPLIEELKSEGIHIYTEHNKDNIHSGMYQVVYSEAIPEENPERQAAREMGITQKSYFAALGDISRTKLTISICGTHGKSTTTAMAGLALEAAGEDPLVILGTKVFEWEGKNIRIAQGTAPLCAPKNSSFFLVESCEYHNSFLHLDPNIIVVTNVEPDHLDFFGTEERYYNAFRTFAGKLNETGVIIADFSNPKIKRLFDNTSAHKISTHEFYRQVPTLSIPGKHNRENAACVLAIAKTIGSPMNEVKNSLRNFHGTWRRFEKKGEKNGILVFDDYAHHPTEIKATLTSFREKFPKNKIWAVFQPHQYSRTREFLKEFSRSFQDADEILIPNIYRVRDSEEDVQSVSAEILVSEIKKQKKHVRYTEDFKKTVTLLRKEAKKEDVIVTIGAGPIFEIGEDFLNTPA